MNTFDLPSNVSYFPLTDTNHIPSLTFVFLTTNVTPLPTRSYYIHQELQPAATNSSVSGGRSSPVFSGALLQL